MLYQNDIFDLYGTLVDIHTEEDTPQLWESMSAYYQKQGADYCPEELRDAYFHSAAQAEVNRSALPSAAYEAHPEIRLEWVFQKLFQAKGVDADLEQAVRAGRYFRELSTKYIQLYSGAKELLQDLREHGHRIWLLSNAQSMFTTWELELLELTPFFDGIYLSSDYGVKKPDRRFFDILLQEQRIAPETAVMIGNDGLCDIQGAKGAGLATLYIRSNLSPAEPLPAADYVLEEMNLRQVREILTKTKEYNRMEDLKRMVMEHTGKECAQCSDEELYHALLLYTKQRLSDRGYHDGKKKLYYISAEFLTGKLLSNNLINLGIYDQVSEYLRENGKSLASIEDIEPEPSLGNGGLGRLAACFLDSIATLGLPGEGIGLNYHLGLFQQTFQNHLQREMPNPWIPNECWQKVPCWLTPTPISYMVPYRGFSLKSTMYDMDVSGYDNKSIRLHLFDTDIVDETIVGDGIAFDKKDILHNLTLFLYPDDSDDAGRKLRIYQQYFMVSSAAQYILEEAVKRGSTLYDLPDYVVIQINDTHPSMMIPELIRLLTERGLSFDDACHIVPQVCAYTNHTILAEALEKWPVSYLEEVVPQLVPIIRQIDQRMKDRFPQESVAIIDGNQLVHMAHMDIHFGFSINGVAALHTEILKHSELKAFYEIYPEKFNNKTNGITFRRWLLYCNHDLTRLITDLIGPDFQKDGLALEQLLAFRNDKAVLEQLLEIKSKAKCSCKDFIRSNTGIEVDENSIFDIQIKRLHEYKRQQLNALYIIWKYLEIKAGRTPEKPVTFIFGAKAAPAYTIAKDIIHLLLCLQELLQHDPEVSPYLKLVMIENYNVTAAEKLIPACDISEQISLASKEASGTGNMKFMLNGAVTLGTMDGANVEIRQLVGPDNIYIFGQSSEEIIQHYANADYHPKALYDRDEQIRRCVDFITGPELTAIGHTEHLSQLHHELVHRDWFMTLLDFHDYVKVKNQALSDYTDRLRWAEKMLVNIAKSGYFSSDRTIMEYNRDIWHL